MASSLLGSRAGLGAASAGTDGQSGANNRRLASSVHDIATGSVRGCQQLVATSGGVVSDGVVGHVGRAAEAVQLEVVAGGVLQLAVSGGDKDLRVAGCVDVLHGVDSLSDGGVAVGSTLLFATNGRAGRDYLVHDDLCLPRLVRHCVDDSWCLV